MTMPRESTAFSRDVIDAPSGAQPQRGRGLAGRLMLFVEGGHARACAILMLIALVCFVPGINGLQPMDRDEPRYTQATKQMLETGDFIDIRFQDEARHKKPVGIYWMQAASVTIAETLGVSEARTNVAIYRIPSLIGALGAVLATYWAGLALARRREAFLAGAFMAASLILMVEARLAKTDAMLLACIVVSMGALARAYLVKGAALLTWPNVILFWGAIGLGVLIKGPVILLFAGLAAVTLSIRERSLDWLRALRPGIGIVIALAIAAPWFIAITWRAGADFFAASAGEDMLGKLGTAQIYHWAPPGTYLALFFVTFWPAAILASIAVPFAWANRRVDVVAFLLAWIVPGWIVFELVPTKLPHYVMPVYPAIAILTAMAISHGFVGPHRPLARPFGIFLGFVPLVLVIALPIAGMQLGDGLLLFGMPLVLVAALVGLYAWWQFLKGRVVPAALTAVASAMVLSIGVFQFVQPLLRSLQVSPDLAAVARSLDCADPAFGTLGYREPSLVFLVGTDLAMLNSGADAVSFLEGGDCRMVFVESRQQQSFIAALRESEVTPALLTRVEGFNINGGRPLDIGVYRVAP
ncbi:MAG: ArnT family glycosyltransferase [Salinarimonas sp.]